MLHRLLQADKDVLSALAASARLRSVGAVNNSLSFLCVGDNAGPAKLAKAKEHGIAVMTRVQFIEFLETGEIPNSSAFNRGCGNLPWQMTLRQRSITPIWRVAPGTSIFYSPRRVPASPSR